jgi:hypothetical protein
MKGIRNGCLFCVASPSGLRFAPSAFGFSRHACWRAVVSGTRERSASAPFEPPGPVRPKTLPTTLIDRLIFRLVIDPGHGILVMENDVRDKYEN